MRQPSHSILVPLLILTAVSCQSLNRASRHSSQVHHIVICWLKEPGNEEARLALIQQTYAFQGRIPGLVRVAAGTTLPSDRSVVDTSFDVAIVMTFHDEQALREYDDHPLHKQAVENVLRPLVERVIIYDFSDDKGPLTKPQ